MTEGRGQRRRRVLAVGLLTLLPLAGVLGMAGCGDGSEAGDQRPYAGMEQGLRRAEERARAGDAAGARREFLDNAHDPLHRLAAEAAERDRAAAARLLEAKQGVERSLDQGSPGLAEGLGALRSATAEALRVVGQRSRTARGSP
jgi:hypothetical protein